MSAGSSYPASRRSPRGGSPRGSGPRSPTRARARTRRRRTLGTILAITVVLIVVGLVVSQLDHEIPQLSLPLRDAQVIREQAAAKHLDPALVAAVIYAETKFEPRTSSAGALGLMQILPETANFIARRSGGVSFTTADLATPEINVSYGSYYLRYLLEHYGGDEMLAVAAYNGGLANVDRWRARALAAGHKLSVSEIPFPETEAYVRKVLQAQRDYRATYPRQLGIS